MPNRPGLETWRSNVEQERIDVEHYLKLAKLAEAEGLVALKMRMEEQAADEDGHRQEMQRMLG